MRDEHGCVLESFHQTETGNDVFTLNDYVTVTLTFGPVILLFGALSSLPPASLQDLQPVALLQLQDSQSDLVSVRRA